MRAWSMRICSIALGLLGSTIADDGAPRASAGALGQVHRVHVLRPVGRLVHGVVRITLLGGRG